MAKVIVESSDIWSGEYPLDLSFFTNRELHMIKKETGIRAGELFGAFDAGDTDLLVALAMIAIRRAGKGSPDADVLWELPAGKITLDVTDEDADAGPPAEVPDESSESDRASSSGSSASGESSQEPSSQSDSGNPG